MKRFLCTEGLSLAFCEAGRGWDASAAKDDEVACEIMEHSAEHTTEERSRERHMGGEMVGR